MSYGVMGGFMQPRTSRPMLHVSELIPLALEGHVQVLLNVLRGMTPQAALDAPRFCISAGLPDADTEDAAANAGNIDSEVWMEEGISDEVVQKLRGKSVSVNPCDMPNSLESWRYGPRRQEGIQL